MCVWVGEEKEERDPPTNTTQTHTNTHTHTCLEVHRGREDVLPQVIVEHIRQQPHQRVQPPELLGVPGLEQRQGRHGQAQALTPSSSSSSHSTLGPTITGSIRLHHRSSSSSNSSRRSCRRLLCLRLRLIVVAATCTNHDWKSSAAGRESLGPPWREKSALSCIHTHTHTQREREGGRMCVSVCVHNTCVCVCFVFKCVHAKKQDIGLTCVMSRRRSESRSPSYR